MISCYTTKEVMFKLKISREAVRALGEILRVPMMSERTRLWTDNHVERARRIIEYGKGEVTSL